MDRSSGGLPRFNKVLLRRPVVAVLIVFVAMLSLTRSLVLLDEGSIASGWWTVGVLAWVAYGVVACLTLPKTLARPPDEVLDLSWAFATSTLLVPASAKILELVEMWVYYVAVPLSIALLAITTRIALAASQPEG